MGFEDLSKHGSLYIIFISIIMIAVSGVFLGIVYFTMDATATALETTDCVIENNTLVDSCQELFEMSIYPFLALRHLLVWFSFFFIFATVLGLLMLGYQSGRSPALLGVFTGFVILITYASIEIANMYITLLQSEIFRTMMLEFTVYNKIMVKFPWFVFVISLFSVMIGIVNWQKTRVNVPVQSELDF